MANHELIMGKIPGDGKRHNEPATQGRQVGIHNVKDDA